MSLAWILLALVQAVQVDDLLRKLGDESLEVRDQAAASIVGRWEEWKPDDLAKVRRAATGGDAEVAALARGALEGIELRVRIPKAVLRAVPDLYRSFPGGHPEDLVKVADKVGAAVEVGALGPRDALPVYIELLDDGRDSGRKGEQWDLRAPPSLSVRDVVIGRVFGIVNRWDLSSRDQWRTWWAANKDKPETEWYLDALGSPHEAVWSRAIGDLARLNDAATYPRIFETLRAMKDARWLGEAIERLHPLPPEVLAKELLPRLSDDRPWVRLAAARILRPARPDAAVAAITDLLDRAGRRNDWDLDSDCPRSAAVDWLVSTRHPKAVAYLLAQLKTAWPALKQSILNAIAELDHPDIEAALLEELSDSAISNSSGGAHGANFSHPRLGDLAGMILAFRLQIHERFKWICSTRRRDLNLLHIKNHWRRKMGQDPLPLPDPGAAPVERDLVTALLPALGGEDEEARTKALDALLALGTGAWATLQEETEKAPQAARPRLEAAGLALSNTLRRVEPKGAAAGRVALPLDRPIDLELLRKIGEAWFKDDAVEVLDVELERNPGGLGVELVVTMTPTPAGGAKRLQGIGAIMLGLFGAGCADASVFDGYWYERFIQPFRDSISTPSAEPVYRWIRLDKRWK